MKRNDFRDRVDRRLASLSWDPRMREKTLRAIDQKEEKKMRHMNKGTAALILVLILTIVTMAVGLATGNYFGILQYVPDKADNQAYLDTVLTLGQTYACDAFTLSLNEVAFDGMRLTAAMEIHPREGAEPVFVRPGAKARINGETVETFWEGGSGFDNSGFWAPDISRMAAYPECGGAQIALSGWTDGTFREYRPTDGAVEWELVFDVYQPAMPLIFTREDEPGMDEESWTEEQYDAHTRAFYEAYQDGKIMLDQYAEPWWYLSCIPQMDGMDGGEKEEKDIWQNAIGMGVFRQIGQAVFRFETRPISVHTAENLLPFSLPDGLTVTLEKLDVSVDQASMRLRIIREDGMPAAESNDAWRWSFALLAEGAKTTWLGGHFGLQEDGSMLYESQAGLSGPADRIFIVPCLEAEDWLHAGNPVCQEVYLRQSPVTEEQEEMTVTVDLE